MPWNDQKGGGGGGGPWGGGGSGGPGGPAAAAARARGARSAARAAKPGGDRPDLEETLRRMQERFKRRGDGGGGGVGGKGGGGPRLRHDRASASCWAIGVVGWLFTGIYQVNEQERAVVLRFGTFHRYEEPGFRIRLPNPIEQPRDRPRQPADPDRDRRPGRKAT